MICGEDSGFDLLDQVRAAALRIGHHHQAIAFAQMADDDSLKTPVAATMVEVPLVALANDARPHGEIAHSHRCEHLAGKSGTQEPAVSI